MPLVFAKSVGLVVTPSSTPQRWTVLISSMSAVSRKIFMRGAPGRIGSPTIVRPIATNPVSQGSLVRLHKLYRPIIRVSSIGGAQPGAAPLPIHDDDEDTA